MTMPPSADAPVSEPAAAPTPVPVVETRPIAVPVTSAPLGKPARATGSIRMLAVLAFVGACWWASDLLVPITLALFLALIANPMVKRLQQLWLPRWLGAMVVVIGGLTAAVFVASLLIGPASDWVRQAPTELRQLAPKIRSLTLRVDQANKAAESIAKAAGAATTAVAAAADKPHAPNLWGLISSTPRMLASILAIVLLSYFFLVFGVKLQQQAMAQMPSSRKKRITADILSTIESDLSTYVLTISGLVNYGQVNTIQMVNQGAWVQAATGISPTIVLQNVKVQSIVPQPLSVGISGSSQAQPNQSCFYYASVGGGTPPYSYAWYVDGALWSTGPQLWYTNYGYDYNVNLYVTDALGTTQSAWLPVWVNPYGYC